MDLCLVDLLQARSVRNRKGDLIPLLAVSTGCTRSQPEAGHAAAHSRLARPSFGLKAMNEVLPAGLTFELIDLDVPSLLIQQVAPKNVASKNVEYLRHLLVPMSGLDGLQIGESLIAPGNLTPE